MRDVSQDPLALAELDLEGLRSVWRSRYGPPPSLRSPELLALMLGYLMQAEREGGVEVEVRRALRRSSCRPPLPGLTPGTKLRRDWQGVTHDVTVTDAGRFLHEGEACRSLSEVARRITGSRWNGPRFFGLREEAAK